MAGTLKHYCRFGEAHDKRYLPFPFTPQHDNATSVISIANWLIKYFPFVVGIVGIQLCRQDATVRKN